MINKICEFENRYWKEASFYLKCFGKLYIICFVIILLILYLTNFFYYPESEYKILENEAIRMVETKVFDSKYKYVITNYNSETKDLDFYIKDNNRFVYAFVDNYGMEDEGYNTTRGNLKDNKYLFYLIYIPISVILYVFISAFVISLIIGLLLKLIVYFLDRK